MNGFSEKEIKEIIGKEETDKKENNRITAIIVTSVIVVAVILAIVITLSTVENDAVLDMNKHQISPIADFKYSITDGYATIDKYIGDKQVVVIPEVIEGAPVKHIGEYAFSENKTVTEIAMPDGVISIGEQAFSNMEQLSKILLPDSLETIGNCAFSYCTALNAVNLPEGVTEISEGCFHLCTSLSSVSLSPEISVIGNEAFAGTALTSFTVPQKVTEIPESMLSGCNNLTEIILNDSVTEIGDIAFSGSLIQTISIPESVTEIGYGCFRNCEQLTEITIPDSVTSIGGYIFSNCKALETVKLSENLSSIPDGTFSGCASITAIDIPESVKAIGNVAFKDCSKLSSLELPKNLEKLHVYMTFMYCKKLTEIRIPESVTSFSYEYDDGDPHSELVNTGFISGASNLKAIYLPKTFYDENIGRLLSETDKTSLFVFESGNENYTIKDGNIYNKDMSVLIYADAANQKENKICKYVLIPDSVKSVKEYSLSKFKNDVYILMPDGFDGELYDSKVNIIKANIITGDFLKTIILSDEELKAEISESIADAYLEIKKTDASFCITEKLVISKFFPNLMFENSIHAYISTDVARKHTVHVYPVLLEDKFETLENISDRYGQYLETPKTYYSETLGEYRVRFTTTNYSDSFIETSALVDHFLITDTGSSEYFNAINKAVEIYERSFNEKAEYDKYVITPILANEETEYNTLIIESFFYGAHGVNIEIYPSGYYGDNGEEIFSTENGQLNYSVRLVSDKANVYY